MSKNREAGSDRWNTFISDNAGKMAMIPAYLLCAVLLMMLLLDVFMQSMTDDQYIIFPLAVRMISLIGIICMAACLGTELEKGKFRIRLEDVFFLAFTVCMIISTFLNGISHDAIFSVAYRYVGVYDLIIFIYIYRYCASHADDTQLKRRFFVLFMLVSDLIAAAFFFNEATGSIAAFNGKLEPSSIFFHGNHYGYFLVMIIAVSAASLIHYEGKTAAFSAVSLICGLAALALNRSMGCLIAAGAVLTLMIIISVIQGGSRRRKALIIAAAVLILGGAGLLILKPFRDDLLETASEFMAIMSGENDIYAGNGRWGIWQYVADYIKDAPGWGYGCEGIAEIMKDYTLTSSPHNEPLTYAAFFGIPAAAFYCAGVITSVIKGLKNNNRVERHIAAYAALAYFISSLFGLAMFYTAPFLFIFLGLSSNYQE